MNGQLTTKDYRNWFKAREAFCCSGKFDRIDSNHPDAVWFNENHEQVYELDDMRAHYLTHMNCDDPVVLHRSAEMGYTVAKLDLSMNVNDEEIDKYHEPLGYVRIYQRTQDIAYLMKAIDLEDPLAYYLYGKTFGTSQFEYFYYLSKSSFVHARIDINWSLRSVNHSNIELMCRIGDLEIDQSNFAHSQSFQTYRLAKSMAVSLRSIALEKVCQFVRFCKFCGICRDVRKFIGAIMWKNRYG